MSKAQCKWQGSCSEVQWLPMLAIVALVGLLAVNAEEFSRFVTLLFG